MRGWMPPALTVDRPDRAKRRYEVRLALRGTEIELVPLARAVARLKTVTPARLAETGAFTGCRHGPAMRRLTSAKLPKRYVRVSGAPSTSGPGRLTTIASWELRARTTTASSSPGFSSRCGVCGGTNT